MEAIVPAASIANRWIEGVDPTSLENLATAALAAAALANPANACVGINLAGGGGGSVYRVEIGVSSIPDPLEPSVLCSAAHLFFAIAQQASELTRAKNALVARILLAFPNAVIFDQELASANADGANLIGVLFAEDVQQDFWLLQGNFWLNESTGSAANSGLDSAHPVDSIETLQLRWGPDPTFQQDVTIHNTGPQITGPVFLEANIDTAAAPGAMIRIVNESSTWTVLYSGTLTGVTALNVAGQQRLQLENNVGGFDWNTAGPGGTSLIKQRVRITTAGARQNAVAWLAERESAILADCGVFARTTTNTTPPNATAITPIVGDTFVVESTPSLTGGLYVEIHKPTTGDGTQYAAFVFAGGVIDATDTDNATLDNRCSQNGAWFVDSKIRARFISGDTYDLETCALDGQAPAFAVQINQCNGMVLNRCVCFTPGFALQGGVYSFNNQTLFVGSSISMFSGSELKSFTGFSVFKSPAGTPGIQVGPGAVVDVSEVVWGTDNGTFGVVMLAGGSWFTYKNGKTPTITKAAGVTDTQIAGVTKQWADHPAYAATSIPASATGIVLTP